MFLKNNLIFGTSKEFCNNLCARLNMKKVEIDSDIHFQDIRYTIDYTSFNSITSESCIDDYSYFFKYYLMKNLPCVLKNVSSNWQCSEKWVTSEGINTEYIKQKYGDLKAPIADCDNISYNSHKKTDMHVRDYMVYLDCLSKSSLLYLKDWHLQRLRENEKFYDIPLLFASDWLNEFAVDHQDDDFKFVYIGPQDSWTPLHADVYNSYSWSVNVVGRKKWIFFPPNEENKLKDQLGNLPLLFKTKNHEDVKYFEIIQEKGDAIFVPSGWHHQVINLQDTISINHNWINACNIEFVWFALNNYLLMVEKEIQEFKDSPDFSDQCQIILKSLFGMDFSDFANFVCYIGQKRLLQTHEETSKVVGNFEFGKNHILFDLHVLLKVLNLISKHPLFPDKITSNKKYDLNTIRKNIMEVL